MHLEFTRHASQQMRRRGVNVDAVQTVLRNPRLTRPGDDGAIVYEGKYGDFDVICVVAIEKVADSSTLIIKTVWKRGLP